MTALAKDRMIKQKGNTHHNDPMAADTVIYTGAFVVLDSSGNAAPASTATGLIPRGVCKESADNTGGSAGDVRVDTLSGVFPFKNSASTDACSRATIGDTVYIVDDQTVAKTDGTGTRSAAGKCVDFDDDGVWVSVGIQ